MIELKKHNYISGDSWSVVYGVEKIVEFFELEGRNILFLGKSDSKFKYIRNLFEFKNLDELKDYIMDKSNLFRIDLIFLDIWQGSSLYNYHKYEELLDSIGIQYVIISRRYHYVNNGDVSDYSISRESSEELITPQIFYITDNINGTKSNMDSVVKSHIRDSKIDDIIKE